MTNLLEFLEELHSKSIDMIDYFNNLPEKEIRKDYLKILSGEILVSLCNLKINLKFAELQPDEFKAIFNSEDKQIENYCHNFTDNLLNSILDTLIFQSELVFRLLYANLTGKTVVERGINPILAKLFEDTENNWQKDECRLMVLLWIIRNTIHTGGIYFQKPLGK